MKTSEDLFNIGDTVRLKSTLKVLKNYNGFTFLPGMNYGFEKLIVTQVDDSQSVELQGPDGETWWYPFEMLDFRTIQRKKDEK